jgi:sugar phosphate isomerase/epimerase
VSTNLYRQQRLGRSQLLEIGAHGFEAVELVAAPGHMEPENPAAIADLQQWLAEARLDVSSVRGPTGTPPPPPEQLEAALFLARRIRVPVFVMAVEGTRDKARRNVERVAALATPLGVTVAVEGPAHSPPGSAVHMVEEELETTVGIALDFGRADREGDLVEAIEVVAEHLWLRLPVDGNIDWASVMTTVQKVGYEGPLVFDGQWRGSTKEYLARAGMEREKMERWLAIQPGTNSADTVREFQNDALPGVRGNGITSRMFAIPVA